MVWWSAAFGHTCGCGVGGGISGGPHR